MDGGANGQGRRRLLVICPSTQFGGMEIVVETELRHLDRSRYEPLLFVPRNPHTPVLPKFVDRITALDVPVVTDPPTKLLPSGNLVDNAVGLARMMRRERIDLVHAHHWRTGGDLYPLLAAKLARVPLIRTEHLPPVLDEPTDELRSRCRRHDRWSDLVLLVSNDNRDQHVSVVGRDPGKLRVLHNGVEIPPEVDREGASRTVAALGPDPDLPLIGGVGRLHHQKGFRHLLDAMPLVLESCGPVELLVLGDGELRGELEAQARSLGIAEHVHLPGWIDRADRLLPAFDVAVMPSLYEGLSLTMLDMMAAGRPCVFSDHPSFAEGTDGGRVARLTPIGDHEALAAAIAGLVQRPDDAADLGRAARRHVTESFSIDLHLRRLVALYDEVVGST